ncbi:MAG: hypothetical protein HRT71_04460 [Flavobacteriales bacterium]|nr:hypothetical protein [Flavobacteriales bacterium]
MRLRSDSPLNSAYNKLQGNFADADGWNIVVDCGQPDKEQKQIETGSVLADWSHIAKVIVRGDDADEAIAGLNADAAKMEIGATIAQKESVILRLTSDEYLVLSLAGEQEEILSKTQHAKVKSYAVGGGYACLVLAGSNRNEVWERSTAFDLITDKIGEGRVIQTSVHGVHCTIYRMAGKDLIVCNRDLAHFLMDALMDVGHLVGLMPTGVNVVPISFV